MQDKHNDDNTFTVVLSLKDLGILENWGDAAADVEQLDDDEAALYDRLTAYRIELEVHKGTEAPKA